MGAYLSEPLTEKHSEDAESKNLRIGSSSMQGWRISQEDAHNALLDFEEDSSLFAVYDGHGGHEVAVYTANKLPQFIKSRDLYAKGDIEQALIESFVEFDRTIVNRDVVSELKVIAGTNKDPEEEANEAQEVDNLCKEATMPIEEVLSKLVSVEKKSEKKVQNPVVKNLKLLGEGASGEKKPISPFLRAKSSNGLRDSEGITANSHIRFEEDEEEKKPEVPEKEVNGVGDEADKKVVAENNGIKTEVKKDDGDKPSVENGHSNGTEENEADSEKKKESNGDPEVKDIKGKGKGKGKGKSSLIKSIPKESDEDQVTFDPEPVTKGPKKTSKELYQMLKEEDAEEMTDDESDEDEEGKAAWGGNNDDSSDEEAEGEQEEEEEEEESDTEDEELGEDEEYIGGDFNEEPGNDSGCTAVVALLKGNQLYVANAGDSRCVVSRDGKALEMSFDHKPEDDPERERIQKAGGRVTPDGRVNGGLNLSRAIGDHAYKTNKSLPLTEQMISPVPDIKKTEIDLKTDDFFVLACDGIWNSMSSQEVIDFVGERLKKDSETKLSLICEELFDHCLAPDTMGDGTGCDNMTAVIVQLKKNSGVKRQMEQEDQPPAKKVKEDN